MYYLVRFTRLRLISVTLQCGLGLSRCRRRRPPQAARAVVRDHSGRGRRERPKFQEPPSSAATVQNLRRPRRHNRRRLVARPAAHHRFCSFKSEHKPQPTPRHCRLTGLNHALTYSNLAPISWRSEKLRRSPCTGHQVGCD